VDALSRPVDLGGQAFFEQAACPRSFAGRHRAVGLAESDEYDRDVVGSYYPIYLRRSVDAGGLNFFSDQLQRGVRDEQVIASLVGSDEYFARV